ncbi:PF20097 family protein [Intestinibacillus massiliensis]|uniref:PF20097 family protein n=1 Tax=Intestinibacillus massiliensis TaxID=1871029 RepID=UPI000B36486D|nr:PF20097 family protein [Intestinibacillus massiliensis]
MKCPYCQEEMLLGYIPNGGQPVQWIPEGGKPSLFSFSVAEKGIPLMNRFKPLKVNGYQAQAHYCPKCKVVIAPTKES